MDTRLTASLADTELLRGSLIIPVRAPQRMATSSMERGGGGSATGIHTEDITSLSEQGFVDPTSKQSQTTCQKVSEQ